MISHWIDQHTLDALNLYCASAALLYLCGSIATHEAIASGLLVFFLWEAIVARLATKNADEEGLCQNGNIHGNERCHEVKVDGNFSDGNSTAGCAKENSILPECEDRSKEIAIYRNGACVYADGSPAPVLPGLCADIVPHEYLISCKFTIRYGMRRLRCFENNHTEYFTFAI